MERLTTNIRFCTRLLLFSLFLTTTAPRTLGQQPSPAGTAADQSSAQSHESKRQEAFKIVWQTVNDLFYDPTFGGVNWTNVRERYEPLVSKAKSDEELHELLQQMLNELHQSHFMAVTGTAEFYEQTPGKSSLIIDAPGLGILQRTFDGSRGWLQDPLQGYINLINSAQENFARWK